MKGINGKAVLKASEIINEITEKGNLKKYKLSLYDFNLFYGTVVELYNAGHAETINEKVKDLLVKCGFESSVCGIGWKINAII